MKEFVFHVDLDLYVYVYKKGCLVYPYYTSSFSFSPHWSRPYSAGTQKM